MVHPLLVIFDVLESQKHAAQDQRQNQKRNERLLLAQLRGAYRQHHGEAAADQHAGVDRADGDVHEMAGGREGVRVHISIDGVASEHAAEEHDFGHQEDPHAQRGGFQLLRAVVEMMPQVRLV